VSRLSFLRRKRVLLGALGFAVLPVGYFAAATILVRCELSDYRGRLSELSWESISYRNPVDDTGPLNAYAVWPREGSDLRMLVLLHDYTGSAGEYFSEAVYWADQGFFVLVPDMRGRASDLRYPMDILGDAPPGGVRLPGVRTIARLVASPLAEHRARSAGVPDSNGAELIDIRAAIDDVRSRHGSVLSGGVDAVGYSGGGSNALFAAARMPQLFDRVVAFFPIVDFAAQEAHLEDIRSKPLDTLRAWVGGRPGDVPDRYAARDLVTLAPNLRHTRAVIVADQDDRLFVDERARALAAQSHGTLELVMSGPGDDLRWHHGTPTEHTEEYHQAVAEFLARTPPREEPPVAGAEETWVVAGYLQAADVEVFLGDLQGGVARCVVTRRDGRVTRVSVEPVQVANGVRARVRVRQGADWVEHERTLTDGPVAIDL
jgi:dienelactone hydrolase